MRLKQAINSLNPGIMSAWLKNLMPNSQNPVKNYFVST